MSKQTYINEVMEELKALEIHDRYDRLRRSMSRIDDAFDQNDSNKAYDILGTPKKYASQLITCDSAYDYKEVVLDVINDTMANVEEVVKEVMDNESESNQMFTKSKYERQSKKTSDVQSDQEQVIDGNDENTTNRSTKSTHYYQSAQFDEPYYKRVNLNKLLAIVLIILAFMMFSTPSPRLFIGIFGGMLTLVSVFFKSFAFIFVVYLIVKVLGKPKQ